MVLIYALTCTVNGKAYIGCTSGKIGKRFREHRCLLNAGKHSELDLQSDWNLYRQDAFRMELVYELEEDASIHAKRAMESFAMRRYKELGLLYNRNEASFQPTSEAIARGQLVVHASPGNRWTAEANLKRSLAQKGIPKNHGHKISATKRAKLAMR